MLEYRKMKKNELDRCARLSAKAFHDYEYFSVYINNPKRRHRFVDILLRCDFKLKVDDPTAEIYTVRNNGRLVAVAQLCRPGFRKPSDMRYITSGFLRALFAGGIRDVIAWLKMDTEASDPFHELPDKCWYLNILSVSPSCQGKGIGSHFLQDFLFPYVRAAGCEYLYLYTNASNNCRFYEKNGFYLFDKKTFEYKGRKLGNWSYRIKLN